MRTKSASKTITRDPNWLGPAIPPGEILLEEYLKPLGVAVVGLAEQESLAAGRDGKRSERIWEAAEPGLKQRLRLAFVERRIIAGDRHCHQLPSVPKKNNSELRHPFHDGTSVVVDRICAKGPGRSCSAKRDLRGSRIAIRLARVVPARRPDAVRSLDGGCSHMIAQHQLLRVWLEIHLSDQIRDLVHSDVMSNQSERYDERHEFARIVVDRPE
jgi:hypothetical protein